MSDTVFLSYSRRQLYCAEAIALHLQKSGVETWFDLQEIEAGEVWSDDLKDGVRDAGRLVLLASRAALDSPYTRAEWEGALEQGKPVVVALYEPVELPEELHGLPTYDFRNRFEHKLEALAGFLRGEAEPLHDAAPRRRGIGFSLKAPALVWLVLIGLFGAALGPLASLLPGLRQGEPSGFFWGFVAFAAILGAFPAVRLWRHEIRYRTLVGSLCASLLLQLVAFFVALDVSDAPAVYAVVIALPVLTIALLLAVRWSSSLLRWLQPGADLQRLRRRVHRPLLSAPVAAEAEARVRPAPEASAARASGPAGFALHYDAADRPLARRVRRLFLKAGLREAEAADGAARHVAILTNRSSGAWVRDLTRDFAGRLIFIVGSTIELREDMAEAGRYQWVDFRGGEARNVETLARSLSDAAAWKQARALETMPAMIDDWKLPPGIVVLKRVMQVLAVVTLTWGLLQVFASLPFMVEANERLADKVSPAAASSATTAPDPSSSIDPTTERLQGLGRALVAGLLFWLIHRGLVHRDLTAATGYGLLAVAVALSFTVLPVVTVPMRPWVLTPVVAAVLYSLRDGWYWFPWFAGSHEDEIGIKESIRTANRRVNIWIVAVMTSIIVGILLLILFYLA